MKYQFTSKTGFENPVMLTGTASKDMIPSMETSKKCNYI